MKIFQIQKLHCSEYPYLVMSTSYVNPLDELIEIQDNLKSVFSGKVLFDLLLTNGLSSNRFIEAYFDGTKFDFSSFKALESVSQDVKRESGRFYQENHQLLGDSVLTKTQQFLIKKGRLI